MSGWTPESLAAHKARLEIIEKLGWGPSSIAGPEWIVERVKREKRELELQNQVLRNAVESAAAFGRRQGFEGDMITAEGNALSKLLDDAIAFCDGKLAEKPKEIS